MKIIIIGFPGSGKSTLAKELARKYKIPLLHLDRIYHIDNNNHISKSELMDKVHEFTFSHEKWIIDGNYSSTIEKRIIIADTIIFMKIPSKICLDNIKRRAVEYENQKRDDMAEGFDNSILDEEFVEFVKNFDKVTSPKIERVQKTSELMPTATVNNYRERGSNGLVLFSK